MLRLDVIKQMENDNYPADTVMHCQIYFLYKLYPLNCNNKLIFHVIQTVPEHRCLMGFCIDLRKVEQNAYFYHLHECTS